MIIPVFFHTDNSFLKGTIKPSNIFKRERSKAHTKAQLLFEDSTGYLPCFLEYEDRNISIINKTIIVFKWSFIRNDKNNYANHKDNLESYLELSDFALEKTVILDKHAINDNKEQTYKIKKHMIDLNDVFYVLSKYQIQTSLDNTFFDLKEKVLVDTDSAFNIFNCVKNNFQNSNANFDKKSDNTNVISLIGKLTWVSQILIDKSSNNSCDNYIFYMILSNYNEKSRNLNSLNLHDDDEKSILIKCKIANFLWVQNLAKVDEIYLIENIRLEKKFLQDPVFINSPAIYSFTNTSNIFLISLEYKKNDILKKLAYFNFDFNPSNTNQHTKEPANSFTTMSKTNVENKRTTVSGIITDKHELGFIEIDGKSVVHLYKCMSYFDMNLLKKHSKIWIDGLEEIESTDKNSGNNFKRIFLASVTSQVRILKFSRNQEKNFTSEKVNKDFLEKKVFREIYSKCAFNLNPHRIRRLLKCVKRSQNINTIQLSSKHYFTFLNAVIFKCCGKPHHACAPNPVPIQVSYNDVSSEIIENFNCMNLNQNKDIGVKDFSENPRVVTVGEVENLFKTQMQPVSSYKCQNFTWQVKQLNNHWEHLSLLLLGVIVRRNSCGNAIRIMDNSAEIDCVMTDCVDISSVEKNNRHSNQKLHEISFFHFCANSKTCKSFCLFTTGFEDHIRDGKQEGENVLKIRNEMLQMPSCPYMQPNHLDCLVRIDKFKLIQEIFSSNDAYDGRPKTFTKNYIVFSGLDIASFGHVDFINLGISFYPYYPEENDLLNIDKNNENLTKDSTHCKTFNQILNTFFSSSVHQPSSTYRSLNDSPEVSVVANSKKSTPDKYVVLPSMTTSIIDSQATDINFCEESPCSDVVSFPFDETFTPNYNSFQNIVLSDAFKNDIELMSRLRYENFIIRKYMKMLEGLENYEEGEGDVGDICQCSLTFIPIGIEGIKLKFKNKNSKSACSNSMPHNYELNVFGMVIDVNNLDCKHCTHLGDNCKDKLNTLFEKYLMNTDEKEEVVLDETMEDTRKNHENKTRMKSKMILIKISGEYLDWYYTIKLGCVYQLNISKEITKKQLRSSQAKLKDITDYLPLKRSTSSEDYNVIMRVQNEVMKRKWKFKLKRVYLSREHLLKKSISDTEDEAAENNSDGNVVDNENDKGTSKKHKSKSDNDFLVKLLKILKKHIPFKRRFFYFHHASSNNLIGMVISKEFYNFYGIKSSREKRKNKNYIQTQNEVEPGKTQSFHNDIEKLESHNVFMRETNISLKVRLLNGGEVVKVLIPGVLLLKYALCVLPQSCVIFHNVSHYDSKGKYQASDSGQEFDADDEGQSEKEVIDEKIKFFYFTEISSLDVLSVPFNTSLQIDSCFQHYVESYKKYLNEIDNDDERGLNELATDQSEISKEGDNKKFKIKFKGDEDRTSKKRKCDIEDIPNKRIRSHSPSMLENSIMIQNIREKSDNIQVVAETPELQTREVHNHFETSEETFKSQLQKPSYRLNDSERHYKISHINNLPQLVQSSSQIISSNLPRCDLPNVILFVSFKKLLFVSVSFNREKFYDGVSSSSEPLRISGQVLIQVQDASGSLLSLYISLFASLNKKIMIVENYNLTDK